MNDTTPEIDALLREGYSKKKRTFGEVQFQKIDSAEGRMTGLLPRAKDGQPRPLH